MSSSLDRDFARTASRGPVDYKAAGVDIEAGNEAVRRIKTHVSRTHGPAVLTGLGAFGSLFSLREAIAGMTDPVMVQSTDGCGTKTIVSAMAGRYEDLGRDLVAAVAGDIVVMGARPLTFLDYVGVHRVDPEMIEALVRGMASECEAAGIALVGGETAEMPSVYAEDDLDVVGFVTGVVEREKVLTGAGTKDGDVLYGISSTGLHTNGWSLARKLLFENGGYKLDDVPTELAGATLGDVLLAPHGNYVRLVRRVLEAGLPIAGMAHITGGGLVENVPRVLPEGLGAVVDHSSWTAPPIFGLLRKMGQVPVMEMLRTFNMGVGLVMIGPPGLLPEIAAAAGESGFRAWELGRVQEGFAGVRFAGGMPA